MAEVIELIVVRTEQDYREALVRMDEIFDADPDTVEGYEAKMLTKAIVEYEEATDEKPPIEADAIDIIRHIMDAQGLRQVDLIPYIGSKSVVSEVLNRKRSLTLEMVRKLSKGLHIPAEALI